MEELLEAMDLAAAGADQASLLEADIAFHQIIIVTARWPQLELIWEEHHR